MSAHIYLSIDRCLICDSSWAVSTEDERGNGTRLTPGKCCGRWRSVMRWRLTEQGWADIARAAEEAIEAIKGEEPKHPPIPTVVEAKQAAEEEVAATCASCSKPIRGAVYSDYSVGILRFCEPCAKEGEGASDE